MIGLVFWPAVMIVIILLIIVAVIMRKRRREEERSELLERIKERLKLEESIQQ
jgi:preprotein translocase subunit YajC